MSQPGPGGDQGLDPDLARVAIAELHAVRQQIEQVRRDAIAVAAIPETAYDAVSRQAFALLRESAHGGPGSLTWALAGGIEYLDKVIAQLETDLAEVVGQDADAAARIGRSP